MLKRQLLKLLKAADLTPEFDGSLWIAKYIGSTGAILTGLFDYLALSEDTINLVIEDHKRADNHVVVAVTESSATATDIDGHVTQAKSVRDLVLKLGDRANLPAIYVVNKAGDHQFCGYAVSNSLYGGRPTPSESIEQASLSIAIRSALKIHPKGVKALRAACELIRKSDEADKLELTPIHGRVAVTGHNTRGMHRLLLTSPLNAQQLAEIKAITYQAGMYGVDITWHNDTRSAGSPADDANAERWEIETSASVERINDLMSAMMFLAGFSWHYHRYTR